MKKLNLIILVIAIISSLVITALAYPTNSGDYDDKQGDGLHSLYTQEMYYLSEVITSNTLGLEKSLSGMSDFTVDESGNVYILVSIRSQIVVLNNDYTLNRTIQITNESGNKIALDGAQGIFVDENKLYICDTTGSRVIITSLDGKVLEIWGAPNAASMPEDFFYQPYRIMKNEEGYIYILSLGCYHGALLYSPQREFLGFYGANDVKASPLSALTYIWEMLTKTDVKKSLSERSLPFAFVDFCLDNDEFMVTCTGLTTSGQNNTGQVCKIAADGGNMYKQNSNGSSNGVDLFKEFGIPYPQNIVSIDVDADNFIYALDNKRGCIYVYDEQCNLVCSFGKNLRRNGFFKSPSAIGLNGTDILVTDTNKMTITVFKITEYGKLLKQAHRAYLDGNYKASIPLWEAISRQEEDRELAYRGLAIAYLSEGRYQEALQYAEYSFEYNIYDMAWSFIKNEYISNNFVWIFSLALFLIISLVTFGVVVKYKKLVLIKNEHLKTALSTPFHPFCSFDDVKYKKLGSITIATVVLLIYYIANLLKAKASGFLDTKVSDFAYNPIYTIIETIGLVLLWTVANRLITSSFDGNGSFKEIFIATSYSLIPITVFTLVRVAFSHFVGISGLAIFDTVEIVITGLTLFIFCVAIMTVHQYDFFKFLKTTIATVLFMVLIIFIILLVGVLWQQLREFIYTISQEIYYRFKNQYIS